MRRWRIGLLCIPLGVFVFLSSTCELPEDVDDMADEGAPANAGTLLIRANIGPIAPVSRDDTPELTPSPEACTSRGLEIYEDGSGRLVERFNFDADCTYEVELAPGTYEIRMPEHPVELSKDLPKTVEVSEGETTEVEVTIDTGIR